MEVLELKARTHKAKYIITGAITYFWSRKKERKDLCVYMPGNPAADGGSCIVQGTE